MPLDIPAPIAAYFAADRADAGAVAACFTDDAIVKDEGRTHRGKEEIAAWKREIAAKISYTSTPIAIAEQDGKTVVTCHIVGNFAGGEVDLRHFFVTEGERISSLEIIP